MNNNSRAAEEDKAEGVEFYPPVPEIYVKRYIEWKEYFDSRISKLENLSENKQHPSHSHSSKGERKTSVDERKGRNDKLLKNTHTKGENAYSYYVLSASDRNNNDYTSSGKSKPQSKDSNISKEKQESEKNNKEYSTRATPGGFTNKCDDDTSHRERSSVPHRHHNEPSQAGNGGSILEEMLKEFDADAGQAAIFANSTSFWERDEDLDSVVSGATSKIVEHFRKIHGEEMPDIIIFKDCASIQLSRIKTINNLRKAKWNLVNGMIQNRIKEMNESFRLQWPEIEDYGGKHRYSEDCPRDMAALKWLGQEWESYYLAAKKKPVRVLVEIAKALRVYADNMRSYLDHAICTKDFKLDAFHTKSISAVRKKFTDCSTTCGLMENSIFLQLSNKIRKSHQVQNKLRILKEIRVAEQAAQDVVSAYGKLLSTKYTKEGFNAVAKSSDKLAATLIQIFGGAPGFLYTNPWTAKREQLVQRLGIKYEIFVKTLRDTETSPEYIDGDIIVAIEYDELFCQNVFLISDDPDWVTRFREPWEQVYECFYSKCGEEFYLQFMIMATMMALKFIAVQEVNHDFDPLEFMKRMNNIVQSIQKVAPVVTFMDGEYEIPNTNDTETRETPSESSLSSEELNVNVSSNHSCATPAAENVQNNMHLISSSPELNIPKAPLHLQHPKISVERAFEIPKIQMEQPFKIPKIPIMDRSFKIPKIIPLHRTCKTIITIPLERKVASGCHRLVLEAQTRAKIRETLALLPATKTSDKIYTENLESGTAIFFTANAIYVSLRAPRWSDQFQIPPEINLIQLPQAPTVLTTDDVYAGSVSLNVYDFLANPDAKFTKQVFMWQGEMVQLSAEEVIALFLHKLKTKILCNPGKDISSDVIAIALPTCISSACKQRLKSALRLTGLHKSVFVQATTAVGATYIMSRGNPMEARHFALVVYLESRSANTALLKVSAGKFETIATGGFLYPTDETSTHPSVYPLPQQLLEKLIASIDEICETAQVRKTDFAEYVCVVDDKQFCPSATPLHNKTFLTWLNNSVLEDLPDCAKRTLPINVGLVPGLFKISLRRSSAPVQEPDFFQEVFPFRLDLLSVMDSNLITETSLVSKNMAAKDTVVNVPTHQVGTGTRPSYLSSYRYDHCCKEMQLFADDALRQISSAVKIQVSGEGIVTTEIVHEWTGNKLPLELTPYLKWEPVLDCMSESFLKNVAEKRLSDILNASHEFSDQSIPVKKQKNS